MFLITRIAHAIARNIAQLIITASAVAGCYLLVQAPAATIGYALVVAGMVGVYLAVGMILSGLHDRRNPHRRRIVERGRWLCDNVVERQPHPHYPEG